MWQRGGFSSQKNEVLEARRIETLLQLRNAGDLASKMAWENWRKFDRFLEQIYRLNVDGGFADTPACVWKKSIMYPAVDCVWQSVHVWRKDLILLQRKVRELFLLVEGKDGYSGEFVFLAHCRHGPLHIAALSGTPNPWSGIFKAWTRAERISIGAQARRTSNLVSRRICRCVDCFSLFWNFCSEFFSL